MKTLLHTIALSVALSLSAAFGASIVYELDTVMFGTQPPAPPAPYATMTVTDTGPNTVIITVESSLSGPGEFWGSLGFNLQDGYVWGGGATIGAINTTGTFGLPNVFYAENVKSGGGGIDYDIWFDFDQAPPGDRFDGNDSFSIVVNGVSTSDFLSTPVDRQVIMHGQGLVDGQSSWVGTSVGAGVVPEPASAMLGAIGLMFLLKRKRN